MPKVDENGIITEGRFQGYRAEDVLEFAETVETRSAGEDGKPPAGAAPRPPQDPAGKLAGDAAGRVDRTMLLLAGQQEKADEDGFAATVSDYDKPVPGVTPEKTYRQIIAETKATMPLDQRIQRGFHQRVYTLIKVQQDAKAAARLFEKDELPVEEQGEEEVPAAEVPVPEPVVPPAAKAAPPRKAAAAALPTPGARAVPPVKAPQPTLQLNDKLRRFTKKMGLDEKEYLADLQRRGFTQADIERHSAGVGPARPGGRKSVYDYVDE